MDNASLQPLSDNQVTLLKQTFRIVDTDRLAMRFYSSLFAQHPEVKSLFPDDLTILSTKIVSVFELVAYSFVETKAGEYNLQAEVLQPLQHLGELHTKKGVVHDYYPWANALLLRSIQEESGPNFTSEMETAWKLALNHLTVAMLSKHSPSDSPFETMRDSFQHIRSLLFKT